ncbi:MAG: TonB family protein [Candidatus Aminicenantes bacterium]|nr:TonB family protein [Candidatus Aminicenantes bacterium]
MTVIAMKTESERFKKAIKISITAHVALFIVLLASPHIRLPKSKKMIYYVNVFSTPGGGGGGGGASESVNLETPTQEEVIETIIPKRESLQDLTTTQKVEEQNTSSLRYPVEKPKREITPPKEKKAVIEKQTTPTPKKPEQTLSSASEGSGSGIKIGIGGGEGSGEGAGSEFASEIGLANFPFPYYPPLITNRVSNFWIKSYSGAEELFTTVFFKIYRDGSIDDLRIVESSKNSMLDRSAIRAITLAGPFAPLPQGYAYDYLEIQLTFEHAK